MNSKVRSRKSAAQRLIRRRPAQSAPTGGRLPQRLLRLEFLLPAQDLSLDSVFHGLVVLLELRNPRCKRYDLALRVSVEQIRPLLDEPPRVLVLDETRIRR